MKQRKYRLLEKANAAKNYARERIVKGATQLENNHLALKQSRALVKGTNDVRVCYRKKPKKIWLIENETFFEIQPLWGNPHPKITLAQIEAERLSDIDPETLRRIEDEDVYQYEKTISIIKKYSLGNCHELALLALDYFLTIDTSDTRAEIFHFKNGDHTFLVIGREIGSDPNDPLTWGKDAIICDPWANEVYLAIYCKENLKNFYPTGERTKKGLRQVNHVEPLKPGHVIEPLGNLNTDYLREKRTLAHLQAGYQDKSLQIQKLLKDFKKTLKLTKKRVSDKGQNTNDPKFIAVQQKILAIKALIAKIQKFDTDVLNDDSLKALIAIKKRDIDALHDDPISDYRLTKEMLENQLKQITIDTTNLLVFSDEDKKTLSDYRNKNKLKTKVMMFFNRPPTSQTEINKASRTALTAVSYLSGKTFNSVA